MIKPLTSLRFFFALMVFASHLEYLKHSNSQVLQWVFNNIFFEGYIGVSFFFILSGFILSYSYQEKLVKQKSKIRDFYIARIARIYPLHIATFILAIPLTINGFITNTLSWLIKAFTNLTLTQGYIPKSSFYFSFNAPSWSISAEMFFYLLFPIILPFFARIKKKKTIYSIMLLSAAVLISLIQLIPEKLQHTIFYISPALRIIDFSLGILIFNLLKINKQKNGSLPNYCEPLSVLLFVIFFFFHNHIPLVYRYSIYYWIPTSIIIYTFANTNGKITSFLSNKTIIKLGEASFGFYMIHQLVIRYYTHINIINGLVDIILLLIISILLSIISMRYLEHPFNRIIKSTFKKNA